jgi:nitrous oxidase accessory protein NosD
MASFPLLTSPRRIGAGLLLVASFTLPLAQQDPAVGATGTVLHVGRHGNDNASGSEAHPLATISAAVRRAVPGTTIIVGAGSYHESVTLQGTSDVTIEAAPGAQVWLDGSTRVRGWSRQGAAWVASGWKHHFDSSPTYTAGAADGSTPDWTFVNPRYPMAAHPDQVWINGHALRQVSSVSKVRARRFYVDYRYHKLYVGTNPTGRLVLASARAKALTIQAPGTTISGINVRRYATSVPMMGSITVEAPGATLSHLRVTDNATNGMHVMAHNVSVDHATFARNGMMGMTGTHANGLSLRDVRASWNNRERFNMAPAAGGVKIDRTSDVVVRGSSFVHNWGTGLWFDESSYGVQVSGSRMIGNAGHGLSLEISGKVDVVDNVVSDNAGNGIKINDVDHIRVWNNTLARNGRPINIVQDDRDVNLDGSYRDWSLPLTYRNGPVTVSNNVVASPNRTANCLLCVEDYSGRFTAEQMGVTSKGNVYQRNSNVAPGWAFVWSRGTGDPDVYDTLSQFRDATGQEDPGTLLNGTRAVTADDGLTSAVRALEPSVAQPVPSWVAQMVGASAGDHHLGAWHH